MARRKSKQHCLDCAFGHWLAGLADGEGSFAIHRDVRHRVPRLDGTELTTYDCSFAISLRLDDLPILEKCQRTTDLGRIYLMPSRHKRNPQAVWKIYSKRHVATLCRFFDQYPLQSKKLRDFAIWKRAVRAWLSASRGRAKSQTAAHDVWLKMAALKDALESGREYTDGSEPETWADAAAGDGPQLRLLDGTV